MFYCDRSKYHIGPRSQVTVAIRHWTGTVLPGGPEQGAPALALVLELPSSLRPSVGGGAGRSGGG